MVRDPREQYLNQPLHNRYFLEHIDLPYQRERWQHEYKDQKFSLVRQPITNRESVDVRARGASKTFDTMEDALYLAYIGYKGIWFSSGKSQLEWRTT